MTSDVSLPDDDFELGPDYAAAWDEWVAEGEAAVWEIAVGDGIEPAG
jgi:hypothetical protein